MKPIRWLCTLLMVTLLSCQLALAESAQGLNGDMPMTWEDWFEDEATDEVVEVSEEEALRYRQYYDETIVCAVGYQQWTLEEHQQFPMYVEPLYEDLPQEGDMPWEDALSMAYGWIEQNEHLQNDDFLHYVMSTQLIAFHGSTLRAWYLEFSLMHGDEDERYVGIPTISVYIDTQTGHIVYTGGYWNSKG